MKYLILIFITSLCFAGRGNYLAKEFINSGDTTGKPVFRLKDKCEAHYKSECFDITGKPIQYNKVIQIEVDDTSKPIYGKKKEAVCIDESTCYALIQPECSTPEPICTPQPDLCEGEPEVCTPQEPVCVEQPEVCVNYCDSEGAGWYPIVAENYSEVYCTKLTGYQKKYFDKLVEDAALKTAYEQEKADKEAEKQAKKASKDAAKDIVKNCTKADDCLGEIKLLLGIE